jgi:hypothetical protein
MAALSIGKESPQLSLQNAKKPETRNLAATLRLQKQVPKS